MKHIKHMTVFISGLFFIIASAIQAAPVAKVTICHKFGTPAENTLTVGYPGAMAHLRQHDDFLGACPQNDQFVDLDGIATAERGLTSDIDVRVGDPLTSWPTGFPPPEEEEGIDWFDNDGTCTWTLGDDLHLEAPNGSCTTAFRDALHDLGLDCPVLDLDGSFFDGQPVDVDLESGSAFTGCLGPDPLLKFFDADLDGWYDNGEDIVLDANNNGIFD